MLKIPLELWTHPVYNKSIMIKKTAEIHARIQPNIKRQAEQVFAKTGHTASEAIEQFYVWTVKHQKTPMRLRKRVNIPDENLLTDEEMKALIEEARKEAREGKVISLEESKRELREVYGLKV